MFVFIIILVLVVPLSATDVISGTYSFSAASADSGIVQYLQQVLNENEVQMEKIYGCSLKFPVRILVPSSDGDYFKLLDSALPDWSGGVAFPSRRLIVLRPGAYFDPAEYRQVMLHEMGHIYLNDNLDTMQVPLWFNEGVAMLASGKTFSWTEHLAIGNAVLMDQLLDLSDIDEMLVFGLAKAQLAYAQSLLAIQYLVREFGESIIPDLLDGSRRGIEWEQVLTAKTGLNSGQFTDRFLRYIQNEYRWALFLQLKNLFWILVVVLFLSGFLIVKIRNRRKIREWEKSEDI
jgi:hypothetical protein